MKESILTFAALVAGIALAMGVLYVAEVIWPTPREALHHGG